MGITIYMYSINTPELSFCTPTSRLKLTTCLKNKMQNTCKVIGLDSKNVISILSKEIRSGNSHKQSLSNSTWGKNVLQSKQATWAWVCMPGHTRRAKLRSNKLLHQSEHGSSIESQRSTIDCILVSICTSISEK